MREKENNNNNINNNNHNNVDGNGNYYNSVCCNCWGPVAATVPISDEAAAEGIQYAVRVLIDALSARSPRVRMRAAELICELYATLEAQDSTGWNGQQQQQQQQYQYQYQYQQNDMQYQRLSPAQAVREAIYGAQGMYFLDLIRNTRDSLFRGALIDIFSISWKYTEMYPYSDFAR